MKMAILELIITTPVQPDIDADGIARNLTDNADMAFRRAEVIRALDAAGWQFSQPYAEDTGDGYTDVFVSARKQFADEQAAEADARACGATTELNFNFGWNEKGVDENGRPNVQWWGEL